MSYTWRDIIKAKAEALAREAVYGDDLSIGLTLDDLENFNHRVQRKMRDNAFHLGAEFTEEL